MQKFHTDDIHYPDLGSASDWLKENSLAEKTNRKHYQDLGSDSKLLLLLIIIIIISAPHQLGIYALAQTSFCEDSSGNLVKRQLFSQANFVINYPFLLRQILEIVTPLLLAAIQN